MLTQVRTLPPALIRIVYFVHGTTTDNQDGRCTGWNPGELSDLGMRQSKELSGQVDSSDFAVIFCSDLKRAVDSARLGFDGKVSIRQDARLRECNYGDFNGAKDEDFVKEDHIDVPHPNGESYKDVERRVRSFLDDMKHEFNGKTIALVAHQAPQLALEVITKGKTWRQAFDEDWRKIGKWQPGWKYTF
ncbi:MAG: histidine phosphatase family protein [Nanoarchaeota archaeon]